MKSNYLISFDTLLITPTLVEGKLASQIIDKNLECVVLRKPLYLIRKSCLTLGLSYEMARKNAKNFFSNQHKLPIVISHQYGMPCIFFPTLSPSSPHNSWVGLHAVKRIDPSPEGCALTLTTNQQLTLDISYTTMLKQYANATLLYRHFKKEQQVLVHEAFF
ncbi:competence protein ComK [Metalysinibacillus jejuensis]|uniref:competence protein ComK n=1 Tax=Metalysinibacillus jejuensis TaxID=914327 RepID=UPI000D36843F|nr:competence protein ComK [Metalysinibacillus jejuensis]